MLQPHGQTLQDSCEEIKLNKRAQLEAQPMKGKDEPH